MTSLSKWASLASRDARSPDGPAPELFDNRARLLFAGAAIALTGLSLFFLNPVLDYRSDQKNDAFFYLSLTRSLVESGTYPSRHWPPGLSLLLYPVVRIAGLDIATIKVVVVLIGLSAVWLSYRWFATVVRQEVAALLALSIGTSPWFFDYSHRVLSEVPFAACLMLFMALASRPSAASAGGRRILLGAAWLAGSLCALVRGNGVFLGPAVALAVLTAPGRSMPCLGNLTGPARILFVASLTIAPVWLQVRNASVDYPGINGSSYAEELLAKTPDDLWRRQSREGAPAVQRASLGDFADRAYKNLFWAQKENVPRLLFYPLGGLLDRLQGDRWLSWLAVLPVWLVLLVGVYPMLSRAPAAFWFVVANAVLLLFWPWPWGSSIRFLIPLQPLLMLWFYLGLERLSRPVVPRVVLVTTIVLGVAACVRGGLAQAAVPYASDEFPNIVALVEASERHAADGEFLILEDGIAPLAHVLTGTQALPARQGIERLLSGSAPSVLLLTTPERPWNRDEDAIRQLDRGAFRRTVLQQAGRSSLERITRRW